MLKNESSFMVEYGGAIISALVITLQSIIFLIIKSIKKDIDIQYERLREYENRISKLEGAHEVEYNKK